MCSYHRVFVQDKLLVTVNQRIVVLSLGAAAADGKRELEILSSHKGKVVALYVAVQGDQIIVGDLMRSIALYQWFPAENRLELKAEEHESAPPILCLICRGESIMHNGIVRVNCQWFYQWFPAENHSMLWQSQRMF